MIVDNVTYSLPPPGGLSHSGHPTFFIELCILLQRRYFNIHPSEVLEIALILHGVWVFTRFLEVLDQSLQLGLFTNKERIDHIQTSFQLTKKESGLDVLL